MTVPPLPDGYDETRHIQAGRPDCHITAGFDLGLDLPGQSIPRFLIQLHYQTATDPLRWTAIARLDHNEQSATGHDVYQEGLHVDVQRERNSTVHLPIRHPPLPPNRGIVIRSGAEYLADESQYFIDVYEGRQMPGMPPRWPDGGRAPPTLMPTAGLGGDMTREQADKDATVDESAATPDALTLEELSEDLATATGTSTDVIEEGAAELTLGRPWECQPTFSEE